MVEESPSRRGRVALISPVRNEQPHIELVVRAMAEQHRPPDCWVVVDDGSDDGTLETLRSLEADVPFMSVISTPPGYTEASGDRLAAAAAPRAFNFGLRTVDWTEFTHIGKLDGDIELPPDYFERLLRKFDKAPWLGIAGGVLAERSGDGWRRLNIPRHYVQGALKLYSVECFRAIGGVHECLGWDGIDGVYARMRRFETRSFTDLVARHHRPWGSADGTLRGRARHGQAAYILHYPPSFTAVRALKVARARPRVLSGAAFAYGYARAAVAGDAQVDDPDFRAFVRAELRARLRKPLSRLIPPGVRGAHAPSP
jgi:glycosyltransferase involved in cell wall biosynthesis